MSTDTLDTPAADPAERSAPLVARLVEAHGASWVGLDTLADFLARPGDQVLFFHGDPVRFPEVLDVAVVLPELRKSFGQRFGIGVATRADEDALAARFAVARWPSLLFLRDGQYVGVVAGMLDWTDYLSAVQKLLDTPTSRVPGIGIPVVGAQVSANSASGCH